RFGVPSGVREEMVMAHALTDSRNRLSTLSPHGPSHAPAPSPSTVSMAPVGQAVAHAGRPPQRLHLLALSVCGSVKTVPNGQAMVHRWQPTHSSPSTTLAPVSGSMPMALTGQAFMHHASAHCRQVYGA